MIIVTIMNVCISQRSDFKVYKGNEIIACLGSTNVFTTNNFSDFLYVHIFNTGQSSPDENNPRPFQPAASNEKCLQKWTGNETLMKTTITIKPVQA